MARFTKSLRIQQVCRVWLGLLVASWGAASPCLADLDYHGIGWANVLVPGGGQFLLGDPLKGTAQALGEIGSFGWGYSLSRRSPLSLDGVPEDIPSPRVVGRKVVTRGEYCRIHVTDAICSRGSPSDPVLVSSFDRTPQNIQRSLSADILQEFGIKYHMVNVFESYRQAAGDAPGIDPTPTGQLFLAPFNWSVLSEPSVYVPIGISVGVIFASYALVVKDGLTPGPRLTHGSNRLYAATYGLVFPFGSAAPEEMFYRGFIQNEAYTLVPSPWFAVPASALAYTLSHSVADMPSAAVTGLWLGTRTYLDHGLLSRGIAYHFWADFFAGLLAIQLLQKSEFYPASHELFKFTWYL